MKMDIGGGVEPLISEVQKEQLGHRSSHRGSPFIHLHCKDNE